MPIRPNPIPRAPSPITVPSVTGLVRSIAGAQDPSTAVSNSDFIPEGVEAFAFYATPGAGASATAMNRPGVASALPVVMPYRGSLVAITLSGTASIAGGGLTLTARKNGSDFPGGSLTWGTGQRAVARFGKGIHGFVRDDYLDVTFTTTAAYTPTTTVVEATLWVTQDDTEIA